MTIETQLRDTRVDALVDQVQFLVDEAEERRRVRETLTELTHDLSPIAGQGMESLARVLTEAEHRGYAGFARSGLGVVDRVVGSFDEDDVEALGDNIVLILETVKEMTQPEIMQMMRSTFHGVSEIEEPAGPPSIFQLLRQMREPQVRLGLARLIVVLRSLGNSQPRDESPPRKEAKR